MHFTFNIFSNQFNTHGSFLFPRKLILHSGQKIKMFMSNLLSTLQNYIQNFEMYFYLNKEKNQNVPEKFGHLYIVM